MNTTISSRTVLVTGGAGYIGSHACKELARNGYTPVCYDNLSRGHDWAVRWGPLEQGDILDGKRLEDVLRRHKPCAAMHFAALAYVGESVAEPALYYQNNVAGSLSLLRSLQAAGVQHFIFSSTCATYGMPQQIPITEDHPQDPINPYGASKLMIERMLADFSAAYGLRSVSLRYFNAAGADPEGEIGEAHDPETHLIPLTLRAAAGDLPCLDIYGDDYPTDDGTCIRDYIHVTDLADAHVLALEYLLDGGGIDAFNLGSEAGFSVNEIVRVAEKITNRKIKTRIASRRPGDPPCLIANSARIRRVLSWNPVHADIDAIIRTAWNWQQVIPC
jgi:UDP-arabinose 4-epimerase